MLQLTDHFALSEFQSRDTPNTPQSVVNELRYLALNLEIIRSFYGTPIIVTSGYRTHAHNFHIGGAVNSQHLYGRAADIVVDGATPRAVYRLILFCMRHGLIAKGGLKAYKDFTHYDTRGEIVLF